MDTGGLVALVLGFVATGGVLLWVAGAARSGSLVRNNAVGIRSRATLASDEAWRAGHEAAHGTVRAAALACFAAAALVPVVGVAVRGDAAQPLVAGVAVTGWAAVVVLLVVSGRRADAAARRVTGAAPGGTGRRGGEG